jgi:hypothetical protein
MLVTVSPEVLERLAPDQLAEELERSRIVFFPRCPIALPEEADLDFLRNQLIDHLKRKNVSFYPDAGRVSGLRTNGAVASRAVSILSSYSAKVRRFLDQAMPNFLRNARHGTSSFRPLQERGRKLNPHASNELVHVDAGAYGATHGDRILRFFTNVNRTQDRIWLTKGSFADLFARHREAARLTLHRSPVEERWLDRAYTSLVHAAARFVPMARVVDSSPYDRAMRRFHNYMKDDPSFRQDHTQELKISFPPFCSWMVLTDGVSHACISGQHALVDTFLVPLANSRLPELAPFEILRRPTAVNAA